MAELTRGGFFAPLSNIRYARTPSKIGLNVDGHIPEVIVSRAALDSTTVVEDKNAVLKQAAEYLREEIMSYAANYKASWPPTCDSLKEEEKDYPSILNEFFTCVLKSKDRPCSDSIK